MFSGSNSMITNALIQLGRCLDKNYICLLEYHAGISIVLLFLGAISDFIIYYFRKIKPNKSQKNKTRTKFSNKKADIRVVFIIENEKQAHLRIENLQEDEIYCYAKLIKVVEICNGNENIINVNDINPRGLYLRWEGNSEMAIIRSGFPKILNIASSNHFTFYQQITRLSMGHEDIKEYIIEVQLMQKQENRFSTIQTYQNTLIIKSVFTRNAYGRLGHGGYKLNWKEK